MLQLLGNTRITPGSQYRKGAKWIPYLRTKNLKNHTLFLDTYLYSLYMGVIPPHPLRAYESP